jgi:hypothetical protein
MKLIFTLGLVWLGCINIGASLTNDASDLASQQTKDDEVGAIYIR